ncbi:MAG: DUF6323 family protein [Eubacteriales bacterium]|nr:DUF6323 family protein [Eubacteriales bacterium]
MIVESKPCDFSLTLMGGALIQREPVDTLLACNEKTATYGLALTAQQAIALSNTQEDTLKKTGRIEFGGGVTHKLILAFCDSPYISQINYEDTLHELIDLFYSFKNETSDRVSDDALVAYMKKAFNERRGVAPVEKLEATDD